MKIRRISRGDVDHDPWAQKLEWPDALIVMAAAAAHGPERELEPEPEPEPKPRTESDERWIKLIPLSDAVTREVWHEADYDRDVMLQAVRDIANADLNAGDILALYRHRRSKPDGG